MLRCLIMLGALTASLNVMANQAEDDTSKLFKPKMSISLDYIPAENNMYGITLAPYHFDTDYSSWGYYIGYAASQEEDLALIKPAEGYTQDKMWRFGLSYSLTQQLSLYGGAVHYSLETHSTTGKTPKIVDGEPIWEKESDTSWGGELGIRYMMDMGLMLGVGYNTSTDSAVISIGYAM